MYAGSDCSDAFPARTAIYIGAIVCVAIFGAYGPGYGAVDFIYAQF